MSPDDDAKETKAISVGTLQCSIVNSKFPKPLLLLLQLLFEQRITNKMLKTTLTTFYHTQIKRTAQRYCLIRYLP